MSATGAASLPRTQAIAGADPTLIRLAEQLYQVQRVRDRRFGEAASLFRDPAWSVLLDLFVAEARGRPISACSAALASGAPQSTGLRWVESLVGRGLLRRTGDPSDGRRDLVELTAAARDAMVDVLSAMRDAEARSGSGRRRTGTSDAGAIARLVED